VSVQFPRVFFFSRGFFFPLPLWVSRHFFFVSACTFPSAQFSSPSSWTPGRSNPSVPLDRTGFLFTGPPRVAAGLPRPVSTFPVSRF